MVEASVILGWLSAALLFAAIAAWLKLGQGSLPRLNGRATLKTGEVESASRLLWAALVLSAVAAILAIAGWMFG